MRSFFNKYWFHGLLIAATILVGFLAITPTLIIRQSFIDKGEEFVMVQFKTYPISLYHYVQRAREIYDGHFPPSDMTVLDKKPTIMNLLPPSLFAGLLYLTKGDLNWAYLLAQFFFNPLAFLAFYFVGKAVLKSRLWALFLALVGVLTPIPQKLPFYGWGDWQTFSAFFLNHFIPIVRTQMDKLYLNVLDNPLITYVFYLAAVAALIYFWQKPKKSAAVLAGVAAGLLFYVYFHYWVYLLTVIGILFAYAAWNFKKEPERFRLFILLLAVLALLAIPYFVNYFRFQAIPEGRTIGLIRTNTLNYDYPVYVVLAALTYYFYYRKNRNRAVLFWALCGAMFIVWNIQLILGYVPSPQTFFRPIGPIIFIMLFAFIKDGVELLGSRRPDIKKVAAIIVIVLSIFVAGKKVVNVLAVARQTEPRLIDYYKFDSGIAESWRWVEENLESEPVIISPSFLTSLYLSANTSARPYMPRAMTTLLPMREMEERYLTAQKLFGVKANDLEKRLSGKVVLNCSGYECPPDKSSNLLDDLNNLYDQYFWRSVDDFLYNRGESIYQRAEPKIIELLERYKTVKADWSTIGADYVYFGPLEKDLSAIRPDKVPNLELVYKNTSVEIYKIE